MKLLFLAALRNSKHLLFAVLTLLSLILLTVSNQVEMISLGIMTNTGSDFFSLFGKKEEFVTKVSLQDIEKKWPEIDKEKKGWISQKEASQYLSKKKNSNPLHSFFHQISSRFDAKENFLSLIFLLIFVALFKAASLFCSRYMTQVLSIRITRDLRLQYFQHIQSLPLSFYQDHNLGSLTSRTLGDAGQIASSLNSCLTNCLQLPFTIVTTLVMCFYFSWQLSLVIFLGLPLVIFPIVFLTKKVKKVSRQMQKNQESFTSVLLDFLSGIHTVKIFAMETFSLKKYKEQNDRMASLESKSAKYSLLTRPVLHTITTFCLATVVIFGLYALHLSVAQLLVFCGFLYLFYEPVKKFAEENANVQRGIVAAERMFEVLQLKASVEEYSGSVELKEFSHEIEFQKISFKYKEEWVLEDLSFTLKKGETLAIVGPTGSGKSTLVQLLPRLFEVQKGKIYIDGIDLPQYTLSSLREAISIVPQKPFLFYDTVAENIAFGREYPRNKIEEAAKKAHAHEFIEELPEKYDTLLAEAGKSLSGGQMQRLVIARALLKESASILIFDEATSALDAVSEYHIKQILQELKGKKTQIVIAHRLSMIENADKILYLERGKKIAEGTKAELLQTSLPFRTMWEHFHASAK